MISELHYQVGKLNFVLTVDVSLANSHGSYTLPLVSQAEYCILNTYCWEEEQKDVAIIMPCYELSTE